VETEEQLETLTALGCERVQGFLLARPMTAGELGRLLRPAVQSVLQQP
jgi:EAL domain-containing protein (putative c-di-GMP-specific phosphodiesterase class I)